MSDGTFVPSVEDFRSYFFKIFLDKEQYPDDMVSEQLSESMLEVQPCIYRGYYRRALYYLTAHFLFQFAQQMASLEMDPTGATVAQSKGLVTSAEVASVNLKQSFPSYSKSSDDKYLASTLFGQEFIRLRNKMSRGSLLANKPVTKNCLCM